MSTGFDWWISLHDSPRATNLQYCLRSTNDYCTRYNTECQCINWICYYSIWRHQRHYLLRRTSSRQETSDQHRIQASPLCCRYWRLFNATRCSWDLCLLCRYVHDPPREWLCQSCNACIPFWRHYKTISVWTVWCVPFCIGWFYLGNDFDLCRFDSTRFHCWLYRYGHEAERHGSWNYWTLRTEILYPWLPMFQNQESE